MVRNLIVVLLFTLLGGCAPTVYVVAGEEEGRLRDGAFDSVVLMCVRDANHQICESSSIRKNQGHWIEYKNGQEFSRFREVRVQIDGGKAVYYGVDTRPVYIKVEKQSEGNYYYAYYANATTSIERTQWTMMQGKFVPMVRKAGQ